LLSEVGSLFWYFEVRVRYRRKKGSRSLSHLLMISCIILLLPVLYCCPADEIKMCVDIVTVGLTMATCVAVIRPINRQIYVALLQFGVISKYLVKLCPLIIGN